jgi:hypothetical protein
MTNRPSPEQIFEVEAEAILQLFGFLHSPSPQQLRHMRQRQSFESLHIDYRQ